MGLLEDLDRPVNLFDGTHPEEDVQVYLAYIVRWTKIWACLLGIVTFHCIALSLFFGYHFWWRRGNEIRRVRAQYDPGDSVLRSWLTPQTQSQPHRQNHHYHGDLEADLKAFSSPEEFPEGRRLCGIEEVEEKAVTADSSTTTAGLGVLDVLSSEQHTWKYSAQQRIRAGKTDGNGDELVLNEAIAIAGEGASGAQHRRAQSRIPNSPLSRELSFSRPRPRAMIIVDEEVEHS